MEKTNNKIVKSKVKLKPIFYNKVLHDKTLDYWKLSRCWNGIETNNLTITDAIQKSNKILDKLNPGRPLALQTSILKHNMVLYGTRHKMKQDQVANQNQAKLIVI